MHRIDIPSTFSTKRLLLRKPSLDDAQPIFDEYASDPQIPRFMSWRNHTHVDQTRDYLNLCLDIWASGDGYAFVIENLSAPGVPMGMIDMRCQSYKVEFGYVLAAKSWNKGYATEALKHLVDWSLDQDRFYRASAFCDVDHGASVRVMEKAGMSFEGILRRYFVHPNRSDEPCDCRMYAKVK